MLSGGIFTLVAAVLWHQIPSQIPTLEKTEINAQTIPKIAIGGLFIFSVVLLLQGLFYYPKKELVFNDELYHSRGFRDAIRSLVYIGIVIGYLFIFTAFGFIVSNIFLVVTILIYYHARKWYYYAIPLAVVGIVYAVFSIGLHVSLP